MNEKVYKYFKQISEIPHGSGNTKQISDYLVSFAKEKKLSYIQDESNNVIIFKEASKGRENNSAVIIQGHMDMVTEKKKDSTHDFLKDPLDLRISGDYIYANDTTLGGDDGIAVAYALAILDDDSISHPPLEIVITVDEEIGMLGAAALDMSVLKGKYLLNIDSEEEGSVLVGCAGGMTSVCDIPLKTQNTSGILVKLEIEGAKGGHSGMEINKERANATIEIARVISRLVKEADVKILEVNGGLKDNAIPRNSDAVLVTDKENIKKVNEIVADMRLKLSNEYSSSDESINLKFIEDGEYEGLVLDEDSVNKFIMFFASIPNGVINMNTDIDGMVETSLNLGIFKLDKEHMLAEFSVRSSINSRKQLLGEKLKNITEFLGGKYQMQGVYPAWEHNKNSKLRPLMIEIYKKMFGKELKVEAIHAGLECGYFMERIKGIDIVSYGPDILDIHTTEERMSISSVNRMYDYTIEILKEIC